MSTSVSNVAVLPFALFARDTIDKLYIVYMVCINIVYVVYFGEIIQNRGRGNWFVFLAFSGKMDQSWGRMWWRSDVRFTSGL